jgi:hypothetical protein
MVHCAVLSNMQKKSVTLQQIKLLLKGGPISKHIRGLGANKNMFMASNGA